jgi:hypothetical protein
LPEVECGGNFHFAIDAHTKRSHPGGGKGVFGKMQNHFVFFDTTRHRQRIDEILTRFAFIIALGTIHGGMRSGIGNDRAIVGHCVRAANVKVRVGQPNVSRRVVVRRTAAIDAVHRHPLFH